MSDENDPMAWVAYAEEDYLMARSALRRKRPLVIGACFHAQQCAEKYLKALLVSRNHPFPKTHDLHLLNNLCTQVGILVEIDKDLLDLLSLYASRTRYPGEDPTLDEAQKALKIAESLRFFARTFLRVKKRSNG